jgi:hypothetical protein
MLALLDREASDALTYLTQKPDRYQPILEEILTEKLEDRELASLLSRLVQEMRPQLEVIEKMKVGKQIIGIEAEQMTGGTAKAQQELEQGENVTGAKIKTIGPG